MIDEIRRDGIHLPASNGIEYGKFGFALTFTVFHSAISADNGAHPDTGRA
jgi:hypothetical protein